MRPFTLATLITSRVSEISSGCSWPSRRSVNAIWLPGAPRRLSTESFWFSVVTGLPSTRTIASPALTPARLAGESSIGEITRSTPSIATTSTPRPAYSPAVCSSSCWRLEASRYSLCGSSPLSMPRIADSISLWLSVCST